MDSKIEIINRYLSKYPKSSFKRCICIKNYACNYSFFEGKIYDIIFHFEGIVTLIEFNDFYFKSLKTFNSDDFFKFFKIMSINDIRELILDDILS